MNSLVYSKSELILELLDCKKHLFFCLRELRVSTITPSLL